jgi:hypothetical protein
MNTTYPSITVSGAYVGLTGGRDEQGTLDYWFELVKTASPTTTSPVTIGVTAKGGFSGTPTEAAADPSVYYYRCEHIFAAVDRLHLAR